jgi:putative membrane protein
MAEGAFFGDLARSETRAAVQEIEARTSAEIVVAVKRSAGEYRDADLLFGFACAMGVLLVMLFARTTFSLAAFPAGVLLGFVAGALFASRVEPIRRLLSLPSHRKARAELAARAAFVELGVGATRGRTGVLVLVALFEREVVVVADSGVDAAMVGDAWAARVKELSRSLRPRPDRGRFLGALRALAGPLEIGLPRAADDVNELPDEVVS